MRSILKPFYSFGGKGLFFYACRTQPIRSRLKGQGSEVRAAVTAAHSETSSCQVSSKCCTGVRFVIVAPVSGLLAGAGELICDQTENSELLRLAGG